MGITQGIQAKRAAPGRVPDIVADGVRYTAAHWRDNSAKPPKNGGSVQAFSAGDNKFLWEVTVFEVAEDPLLETDVQDVYITRMEMRGGSLELANDRGNLYRLDITARKAALVSPKRWWQFWR